MCSELILNEEWNKLNNKELTVQQFSLIASNKLKDITCDSEDIRLHYIDEFYLISQRNDPLVEGYFDENWDVFMCTIEMCGVTVYAGYNRKID